jgi:hypothetical protein
MGRIVRILVPASILCATLAACGGSRVQHVEASTTSTTTATGIPTPAASGTPIVTLPPIAPGTATANATAATAPPASEATTGAVGFTPSKDDLAGIGVAYQQFMNFKECHVEPVPGQLKTAVVSATNVEWAFGPIRPVAGCTIPSDGKQIDPMTAYPFQVAPDAAGVFEKQPGSSWQMNWVESLPFPCPTPTNAPEGTNSPYVSLSVLNAVGVHYAPGCGSGVIINSRPQVPS